MSLTPKRVVKGARSRLSRAWWRYLAPAFVRNRHQCNGCGAEVAGFYRYGDRPCGCPHCGASDRERWVLYALEHRLLRLPETGRVLHVAPGEKHLVQRLRGCGEYVAGDLSPERYRHADATRVDLTDLSAHGKFDLIYASHVLEHIPDDRQAMRAVHSALNPHGQAWFMVPLKRGPTIEGAQGMDARERERQFGQWDHVRLYGPDLAARLEEEGFEVRVVCSSEVAAAERNRYGIAPDEKIFACAPSQARSG